VGDEIIWKFKSGPGGDWLTKHGIISLVTWSGIKHRYNISDQDGAKIADGVNEGDLSALGSCETYDADDLSALECFDAYNLRPDKLKAWLEKRFPSFTFDLKVCAMPLMCSSRNADLSRCVDKLRMDRYYFTTPEPLTEVGPSDLSYRPVITK